MVLSLFLDHGPFEKCVLARDLLAQTVHVHVSVASCTLLQGIDGREDLNPVLDCWSKT